MGAELLRDLGTMDIVPVGTRVRVDEDGISYVGIGTSAPVIRHHLRWPLSNVWLPEHAELTIIEKHGVFPNVPAAAHHILTDPLSVHHDGRGPNFVYFFTAGDRMRAVGLLTSRSTSFVDGVVELRHVTGGTVLRLFHLAPTDRNKGGQRVWPTEQTLHSPTD